jgi:probable F420-dependent oxidoreductase
LVAGLRPFRFALQAMPEDGAAWGRLARRAEDLGFSTLQTADHLGFADPLSPLATAAAVTSTLRVGTLVVNNELHHPVLLARQAATVDLLSDGRLELGLGTGYAQAEHDALNLPLSPPGPRVGRLAAAVRLLKPLLAGETVSDEVYGVQDAALGFRAVQQPHPPLLLGGYGDRVLRLAAREAQIVQLTGLSHGKDGTPAPTGFWRATVAERVAYLREVAGDRFDELELSVLVQVTVVGSGAAEAEADLQRRWGLPPEELRASPFVLLGEADALVDKLVELREQLGISYVTVREAEGFAPVLQRLAGT